jgi:hypothetical protein
VVCSGPSAHSLRECSATCPTGMAGSAEGWTMPGVLMGMIVWPGLCRAGWGCTMLTVLGYYSSSKNLGKYILACIIFISATVEPSPCLLVFNCFGERAIQVFSIQLYPPSIHLTWHGMTIQIKGCPSKSLLLYILFSFISASEQVIFTILVPIPHKYWYVRGVGI